MKKKTLQTIALLASGLLCFSACGFQEKEVQADELSATYTRKSTATGEITDDFKKGMAELSMDLLQKTVTKDTENDLVSPLSAALCLGLIANGANGNTLAQLESLFGMDIDAFNQATYAYTSSLHNDKDSQVQIANSIWIKEGSLNIRPAFLQTNADFYGAQAYSAPFDNTTLQDINNWCYNKTKGKINKILEQIDPGSVMYLINALDFDAKWATPYEESDILSATFHNYDESTTEVDMLCSTQYNSYLSNKYAIGFTRPYLGGNYSFVGMLPNEGVDIYDYVQSLNGETWRSTLQNASDTTVFARMPEFEYETDMLLNDALKALGVTDMFDGSADFSKMDETTNLYCDFIKQKTFIQVDRKGTKAAAITMGGMKETSLPHPIESVYITLDRPFLYAIVDNATALPLFIGIVTNL